MSEMPKQTPLVELLLNIPETSCLNIDHDHHSSSHYPVGLLCHDAAHEITALKAELTKCQLEQIELIAKSFERDAELAEAQQSAFKKAIEIVQEQPFYPNTHTGMRQQWLKDKIIYYLNAAITSAAVGGS